MPAPEWISDHGEVLRLARWLVAQNRVETLQDLLYFFEKPWKWEAERGEMLGETWVPAMGKSMSCTEGIGRCRKPAVVMHSTEHMRAACEVHRPKTT